MIERARRQHPQLSVVSLCELLGVSRSWYYARTESEESAGHDVTLRDAIEQIVLEFPGWGYRPGTEQLHREGLVINHTWSYARGIAALPAQEALGGDDGLGSQITDVPEPACWDRA